MRKQAPMWDRETKVCAAIGLQADLLETLRACIELHEMGPVEAQALVCFETVSKRRGRSGLFMKMAGADSRCVNQAVIVAPRRLVWAQREDDGEAHAHWAWLERLDITDYEKSPEAQLIPDHGLQVHGIVVHGSIGTLFFGFGEGPDADHARRVLKDAVRAAHGEGRATDTATEAEGDGRTTSATAPGPFG